MASFRAGVAGAGSISRRHINAWQAHPDVDLACIADISEQAANSRADEFGIRNRYTSLMDMFSEEHIEILSICTWMNTHADIAVAAAEAGIAAILCEKPLAGSLEEVDRIIHAANRNGTRIAVGHHHRFRSACENGRELVQGGAIGQPVLFYGHTTGGLLNNGTHFVDIARYLMDDPDPAWAIGQVVRHTDRHERHDPIEDLCAGIVALNNGARIQIESDMPEPAPPDGAMTLQGTEGTLVVTSKGARLLNGAGGQDVDAAQETDVGILQAAELVDWLEGRVNEHRNAIRTNRATIEILMGIYESARIRDTVTFPLESGPSPLHRMIENGDLPVTVPGKYDIRIKPQPDQD